MIEKIQQAVEAHPIRLDNGTQVVARLSIGGAAFPSDGRGLEQLLIHADQNMYRNKLSRQGQDSGVIIPFAQRGEVG